MPHWCLPPKRPRWAPAGAAHCCGRALARLHWGKDFGSRAACPHPKALPSLTSLLECSPARRGAGGGRGGWVCEDVLCEGPGPRWSCLWLAGPSIWHLCSLCGLLRGLGRVDLPVGSGSHLPYGRSELGWAKMEDSGGPRGECRQDSPCPLSSTGVSPREEQLLRGTLQRVAQPTRVMPASTPSVPGSSGFMSLSRNISPGG